MKVIATVKLKNFKNDGYHSSQSDKGYQKYWNQKRSWGVGVEIWWYNKAGPVRTNQLINKEEKAINNPNPPSHREPTKKFVTSLGRISSIIRQDLHKDTLKETKLQRLSIKSRQNRKIYEIKLQDSHSDGSKSDLLLH